MCFSILILYRYNLSTSVYDIMFVCPVVSQRIICVCVCIHVCVCMMAYVCVSSCESENNVCVCVCVCVHTCVCVCMMACVCVSSCESENVYYNLCVCVCVCVSVLEKKSQTLGVIPLFRTHKNTAHTETVTEIRSTALTAAMPYPAKAT